MPEAQKWLPDSHKYLIPSAVAGGALTIASGAAHFLIEDGRPRFILYLGAAVVLCVHVALALLAGASKALDYMIEVKEKYQRLRG